MNSLMLWWNGLSQKIKRRIRRKWREYGIVKSLLLGIGGAMICTIFLAEEVFANPGELLLHYEVLEEMRTLSNDPQHSLQSVRTMLHRIFECGEETEDLGYLSQEQLKQMQEDNPSWEIVKESSLQNNSSQQIVEFQVKIEDLSNYCKENAYFGVDREGSFSLFDGVPTNERVMKTFFQLDMPVIESRLPKDELNKLTKGIKIHNIDEYHSVISTFSEYSLDQSPHEGSQLHES